MIWTKEFEANVRKVEREFDLSIDSDVSDVEIALEVITENNEFHLQALVRAENCEIDAAVV
jgi:hypothetical protein